MSGKSTHESGSSMQAGQRKDDVASPWRTVVL